MSYLQQKLNKADSLIKISAALLSISFVTNTAVTEKLRLYGKHYEFMKLLTDPVTTVASFDSKGNGGINGESCCFTTLCVLCQEASISQMLLTTYRYNYCRKCILSCRGSETTRHLVKLHLRFCNLLKPKNTLFILKE